MPSRSHGLQVGQRHQPGIDAHRPPGWRRAVILVRRHWPVAVLAVLASCLLFTNLGSDYFWEDEGDTAVLARNIVQHGLPLAWDGVTFVAPDYGQRLTRSFVMVSHPWLQYYAAAASFALFGDTPWAARLPFALGGLLTIVIVYTMTYAWLRNRLVAISAATLLLLNVQFLLFSRQARNYSLHALLTCLLIWQFRRLNSRMNAALFAGIAILLFHAHPIGLMAVAALGLLTVVYRPFAGLRRWFWPAALVLGIYVTPWLLLSRIGYRPNMTLLDQARLFLPRLLQYAVECASVAPVVGVVGLYIALRVRHRAASPGHARRRRQRERLLAPEERTLAIACVAVAIGESLVVAMTHTRDAIWIVGLHHTPEIIPLVMILTGLLVVKVCGSNRKAWIALILVFGFTRLGHATPWMFWADPVHSRDPDQVVTFHIPNAVTDRLLRTGQIQYVKSLVRANRGTIARVSEFLQQHAASDDIVITNYAWEPLYFHTRLPQGMKVSPSFPIYEAVRAANLPGYVFSTTEARWIVWRRAWPAYFVEQNVERLLRQVREAGMVARLVAEVPETLYENRENIHFRRFAGDTYIFSPPPPLPDVQIYRIETFDEAIVHYRQHLANRPDDTKALTELGIALIATGRLEEAIGAFRRTVDIAPADAYFRRNLANALFDHREVVEAASHAQRAVELRPDDAAAHDVLGRALAVQGRLDEAIRHFERALETDPAYTEAREHLARVQQARRNR